MMQGMFAGAAAGLRVLPPETAHAIAVWALRNGLVPQQYTALDGALRTRLCGLDLPHPIGLAAGFDKNAEAFAALLRLGFAFVEAGTVTPLPQPGNPRPRLFRLAEDRALINRMGFNNAGLETFAARLLARSPRSGIVGANIGANKDSPDRIGDYRVGMARVWPLADYVSINVSSPNTPGLRDLQAKSALEDLLGALEQTRARLRAEYGDRPLFLKVAPDLADHAIADICDSVAHHAIDALIVGNTSLERPAGLRSRQRGQAGGLSGRPLRTLAAQRLRGFALALQGRAQLIGVGGIESVRDVLDRLEAGASAVQIYTAFVYADAGFITRLVGQLSALLAAEGHASVAAAIGARLR